MTEPSIAEQLLVVVATVICLFVTLLLIANSEQKARRQKEEQEKLAQSFSDNASRKAKGSGMGLFVVKSLLEHEKLPYRFEMKENRLTFFIAFPKVGKD